MPDRLQELLQQRALIKEHLDWLEAEIAAASGGKPLPPSPAVSTTSTRSTAHTTTAPAVAPMNVPTPVQLRQDAEADLLLQRFAAEDKPVAPPSKTGCWVIFSIVLLVIAAVAWFTIRHFYPRDATPTEEQTETVAPPAKPSR